MARSDEIRLDKKQDGALYGLKIRMALPLLCKDDIDERLFRKNSGGSR
jgi:hypothetical protein